ncbi:MAG: hypothetical protein HRU20_01960 [Pseudomonadales bacterium]|nr:hypothetical protein [Pseudomonadales bacterium]
MLATHTKACVKNLKKNRDELLDQLPMANASTRESWLQLEEKWDQLLLNVRAVAHDEFTSHGNTESTLESLSHDLETGYAGIRQVLH